MSGFCSGLCNEMSRCCYDFFHAPFTKKNMLIGGGILLGIIIFIIIMAVAFGPSSSAPTTAEDILKHYPLIDGSNSWLKNIKDLYMNQLENIKNGLFKENSTKCDSCQTDFFRLKKGRVATQVFSVTTYCDAQYRDAVAETLEQIDLIKRIISANKNKLALVSTASDISKYFGEGKIGVIINVWGGHNIDSRLSVLRMYYDLGVRIMSIVSADPDNNALTCIPPWVFSNNSLTSFGKNVITEMNRLGMVIDLTGSPKDLQENILKVTKAPVIFSHSASLTLTNNSLNVDDFILQNHKDNIGLVMVPFTPSQVKTNSTPSLETVADHFDQINNILKDTRKLGIGSNFDNMTSNSAIKGLEDVTTFVHLIKHLKEREGKGKISWSDTNLQLLVSSNFINVFKKIQKASNLTETPLDNLISKDRLSNTSCYSDLNIRYRKETPPATPTTSKTTTHTTTTAKKPKP